MKYEIIRLKNGLRIVAVPLKERKSVAVGVWVAVGARDEEPRLNGVCHFLEHMVFKGTTHRTDNQIKESVEGVGGSLNAFTSEEATCFLAKSHSRHFEKVFDVLVDMVQSAALKNQDVEKERTVILEEIKMTQDQPSQLADEILSELLWPDHPLGRPVAGTLQSTGALSRADIAGVRDRFYQPPFITVVAAGDITQARLKKAVRARFSTSLSNGHKAQHLFHPKSAGKKIGVHAKKTEQTHLVLGLRALPKDHPDQYAVDLLNIVLGGNMSSRLFNEVREERGLAYDIGSYVRKFHETGAFVVAAGVDNKKWGQALEVILKELRKTADSPVGADELRRAKEFYIGQLELGLENSMNHMLWVGESVLSFGRCRTPESVARHILEVTAGDLKRVARRLFRAEELHLSAVGPLGHEAEKEARKTLHF